MSGAPWQPPETVLAGEDGLRSVQVRPLERIMLELPRIAGLVGGTWSAYQVVEGAVRALPAGASLDAEAGIFYWAPGPGFLGAYELEFVHSDAAGARVRIPVRVEVSPVIPR